LIENLWEPCVGSVKCGGEVGEEIVEGLETDGQADQPRVDGER
jgi:hypothetical protein